MTLNASIRSRLKSFIPQFVLGGVRGAQIMVRKKRRSEVQEIFEKSKCSPEYLGPNELELLWDRYPFRPDYGYDRWSTQRRGAIRARELLRLPGASAARTYLELGCWDGMVCSELQRRGKQTVAIDQRSEGFDERAMREGVKMMEMDAEDLQFADDRFDCVFSYDAFEHFFRPDVVFQNALKVLRKGGHLFLSFGPLYWSPFGQHAYRSIPVPYCHVLFPKPLLNQFAIANGVTPIQYDHVNGWSITRFRNLWSAHATSLARVEYSETPNLAHLDLVRTYPSCFRSKTNCFDDLVVETINAVFEKVE